MTLRDKPTSLTNNISSHSHSPSQSSTLESSSSLPLSPPPPPPPPLELTLTILSHGGALGFPVILVARPIMFFDTLARADNMATVNHRHDEMCGFDQTVANFHHSVNDGEAQSDSDSSSVVDYEHAPLRFSLSVNVVVEVLLHHILCFFAITIVVGFDIRHHCRRDPPPSPLSSGLISATISFFDFF
ncbi:ethylene-responsive transcription factor 4-like [Senna tora]|uniref:Ethylene-responsive transcription factor 4-like n=1 Tax=Senna tora TaxID=362788 RepID=A0A834XAB0_9FABA|nr:ethylene-responsive transcription factor 4-like [Senna tora]